MSRLIATAGRLAARRTLSAAAPTILARSATTAFLRPTFATASHAVRRFASDAAPAAPAAEPTVAELQAALATAATEATAREAKIAEMQDKYTRALAESQNVLTRSQKQIADAKQFAVQSFAKSLLEVADILEIATKAADPVVAKTEDSDFKNLHEGMAMTQKVLLAIFERNGLKKFEPLDEKFDPYFHDGLLQIEDPTKTPGTVGIVLKSGYRLHERCLRAAQVGTVKPRQ